MRVTLILSSAILLVACAKGSDGSDFGTDDITGKPSGSGGTSSGTSMTSQPMLNMPLLNTGEAGLPDPDAGKSPIDPSKLVKTEMGGYQLGPEITSTMGKVDTGINASEEGCGTVVGIVRDFIGGDQGGHPDFQTYGGNGVSPGMVANALGTDNKPVYTGICEMSNPAMATCPFGR